MNSNAPRVHMAPATDTTELPSRLRGAEPPTRELHLLDLTPPLSAHRALRVAATPLGALLWLLAGMAVLAGGLALAEHLDAIAALLFGGAR